MTRKWQPKEEYLILETNTRGKEGYRANIHVKLLLKQYPNCNERSSEKMSSLVTNDHDNASMVDLHPHTPDLANLS
jgi:hypothetical protein